MATFPCCFERFIEIVCIGNRMIIRNIIEIIPIVHFFELAKPTVILIETNHIVPPVFPFRMDNISFLQIISLRANYYAHQAELRNRGRTPFAFAALLLLALPLLLT